MPHGSCNACSKSNSTPRNFLLDCNKCDRSWHHRCHKPPVPDPELLKYIKETTDEHKKQNPAIRQKRPPRPTFTCGSCKRLDNVIVIDDSDDEVLSRPVKPLPNQIAAKKATAQGPVPVPIRHPNPTVKDNRTDVDPRHPISSLSDSSKLRKTTSIHPHGITNIKDNTSYKPSQKQSIEQSGRYASIAGSRVDMQGTATRSPSLNPHPIATNQISSQSGPRFVSLPRFEALTMSIETDDEEDVEEDDEEEVDQLADDYGSLPPTHKNIMDVDSRISPVPARKSTKQPHPRLRSVTAAPTVQLESIRVTSSKPLPALLSEEYAHADDIWARAAARRRQAPSKPRLSFTQRKCQRQSVFRPSISLFEFDVDTWMSQKGGLP